MIFELSRAIVVGLKKGGKRMGAFLLIHTIIIIAVLQLNNGKELQLLVCELNNSFHVQINCNNLFIKIPLSAIL